MYFIYMCVYNLIGDKNSYKCTNLYMRIGKILFLCQNLTCDVTNVQI